MVSDERALALQLAGLDDARLAETFTARSVSAAVGWRDTWFVLGVVALVVFRAHRLCEFVHQVAMHLHQQAHHQFLRFQRELGLDPPVKLIPRGGLRSPIRIGVQPRAQGVEIFSQLDDPCGLPGIRNAPLGNMLLGMVQ